MFKEKEEATQLRAAEVMRELGWETADSSELHSVAELLQSIRLEVLQSIS